MGVLDQCEKPANEGALVYLQELSLFFQKGNREMKERFSNILATSKDHDIPGERHVISGPTALTTPDSMEAFHINEEAVHYDEIVYYDDVKCYNDRPQGDFQCVRESAS